MQDDALFLFDRGVSRLTRELPFFCLAKRKELRKPQVSAQPKSEPGAPLAGAAELALLASPKPSGFPPAPALLGGVQGGQHHRGFKRAGISG